MNRDRVEALLEAAKACGMVAYEMMAEPGKEALAVGAAECVQRINSMIAQEAGFVGQAH